MHQQAKTTEDPDRLSAIEIRKPTIRDAVAMWRLVCECEVLDTNSCYAYLLICRDFAATSLVAASSNELLGFISAYIPPSRPDVVFVWQVCVNASARNRGLAKALLHHLLCSEACRDVHYLEATVTPSNIASRRLFESTAEKLGGVIQILPEFSRDDFGASDHESEDTIRITLNRSKHGNV